MFNSELSWIEIWIEGELIWKGALSVDQYVCMYICASAVNFIFFDYCRRYEHRLFVTLQIKISILNNRNLLFLTRKKIVSSFPKYHKNLYSRLLITNKSFSILIRNLLLLDKLESLYFSYRNIIKMSISYY